MDRSFLGCGADKAREIKCGVLGLAGDRPLWGLVGSSASSELLSGGVPAVAGRRTKAAGAGAMMLRFPPLFYVHRLCREPIARTDIDGEKYLAAIAIWQ